jgi:hypothetical protein
MPQTPDRQDEDAVSLTLAGVTEAERARQIALVIRQSLQDLASAVAEGEAPRTAAAPARRYTVTRTGGCIACEPGACPLCGHLFTGEIIRIAHEIRGRRNLSDKAVHYLSHGLNRYETGYIIRGEPVTVELDLEELAAYLDL